MNRREFLKSMLALGVSLAIPFPQDVEAATELEVDAAWSSLESSPMIFEVSDSGTLWLQGVEMPSTKGQCMGLDYYPAPNLESITEFLREDWRLESVVASAYLDLIETDEDDPEAVSEDEVISWLEVHPEDIPYVCERITSWLDDTSLDEFDYEIAELRGYTPQGAALRFWRDMWDGDDLDIVIVEGDHPGSSYFAAELRQPIEDANQIAQERGLPIRFVTG